jgi:hypothetical protein
MLLENLPDPDAVGKRDITQKTGSFFSEMASGVAE